MPSPTSRSSIALARSAENCLGSASTGLGAGGRRPSIVRKRIKARIASADKILPELWVASCCNPPSTARHRRLRFVLSQSARMTYWHSVRLDNCLYHLQLYIAPNDSRSGNHFEPDRRRSPLRIHPSLFLTRLVWTGGVPLGKTLLYTISAPCYFLFR
jgi:hypothetical protein